MFEYDIYGRVIPKGYDYDGGGIDNFPVRTGRSNQVTATKIDPIGLQSLPNYNYQGATVSGDMSDPYDASIMSTDLSAYKKVDLPVNTSGSGFGARFGANLSSPQAIAGLAGGVGGILQGLIGRTARRNAQREAQAQRDKMMAQYRQLDTSNLAASVQNPFAENVYEDLTVNQQQAQFVAQQGMQQRANIMAGLQGAAGGSGIAGLAQALANQGQLATQKASASIGMQEARNEQLKATGAMQVQKGEYIAEQMRLAGAERARGLEYRKVGTELGMAQQDLAARNRAIAQANAALYGGIGSIVGTVGGAAIGGL